MVEIKSIMEVMPNATFVDTVFTYEVPNLTKIRAVIKVDRRKSIVYTDVMASCVETGNQFFHKRVEHPFNTDEEFKRIVRNNISICKTIENS